MPCTPGHQKKCIERQAFLPCTTVHQKKCVERQAFLLCTTAHQKKCVERQAFLPCTTGHQKKCVETSFLALHPWAWWCLPEAQYCNSYPITPREPSRRDELHRAESRAGRWGGPVLARLELPCSGLSSMLVINLPYCLSQCSQDFLRVFDFPWCMFF